MNLELTDEQRLLREAAAQALDRLGTVAGARAALDGAAMVDQWPTAREAGWSGLLIDESYGGAGLDLFDAMIIQEECGRRLAGSGLVGHLAASLVLGAAAAEDDSRARALMPELADGSLRAALVFASPSGEPESWTTESTGGGSREVPLPRASLRGDAAELTGAAGFVLDAAGADLIVVPAVTESGELVITVVEAGTPGLEPEPAASYDASRSLANLSLDGCAASRVTVGASELERAWHTAQALLAADALGVCETVLEMAVAYAKERHAFGRPIGSYQAIKHQLVEMLRLTDRARSLCVYAAYVAGNLPVELALACACARAGAEEAANFCTRTNIAVHGGIGATFEHDAPLYWRRAQLSRVLLGGENGALDRIADEFIDRARERVAVAA